MRLLETNDGYSFKLTKDYLVDEGIPAYAILSHTWQTGQEVTFDDLIRDNRNVLNKACSSLRRYRPRSSKTGYAKLQFCAKQAKLDGLRYFWVDTCCINKKDSSELQEAINSMFRWYQNAARCYVFLPDVSSESSAWQLAFTHSRWFTRGWTLQELLAPSIVSFYSREGHCLGDRHELKQQLHEITKIPIRALSGAALVEFSIDERLSWAMERQTTRAEDKAYSLLGIFGIYLTLIYGEGFENALKRLRKGIFESQMVDIDHDDISKRIPLSTIPFRRDDDFITRESLEAVRRICSIPEARAALVGLGGVGKSQIAIEYVYQVQDKSPTWAFWVHAETQARFREGYRRIAEVTKMDGWNDPKADVMRLVRTWLSDKSNGRWVMVVDNADDANVLFHSTPHNQVTNSSDLSSVEPLADFLPQKSIGSILVTSRNRDVAYRLTGNQTNIVEVKPMNHQDAFALLQKKLGCNLKRNDAIALTDALGSMPLALTQAASFIKQRAPRMSISRYVKDIHKNDHNRAFLLSKDVGDSRRDGQASNSIITTWHMSFEYIRSRTPAAARLLSLMSFFDRQSIPASLLESSYGRDERPEADFEDDIYTLTSFSLAEWSADGKSLKMHGLVQFCTKRWLELHNEHEHWKEVFLSLIDTTWSEDASENWPTCQALFPHAQAALDNLPVEADALEVWASVAFKVAEYVGEMGDFHKSCKLHRDAFEVREILLGAEHAATLRCLNSLGIALGRLGRYDEAVATHQRDLEASERTLGANDINTLMSMINLASAYKNQGESIESERILKQVLETAHKTELGADHTLVRRLKLNCFTTLALTYRSQGLWERAEELQLQVLEAREEELGKDDPTTRKIRGDLALTYAEQGRLKDAEELRLEILESNKRNPGPETEILVTRSHLAEIYKKQGRWDEAEQLRLQVMERSKILVGLDHPGTILSMSTLASLYWEQGRFKEAEELQLQTLELRKANLGEDHPATLINKNNLSATYWSQGIFDKHEKLEAEILESNLAKLGEFHPNTLRNKAELVFTYKRHGRMEDAQRLVEHVWQARTEVLGPEHPDTLCTMSNLCYTWKQRGFTEKAVPLFEKCCEAYERVLGAEHPDTVRLKARLVEWQSEGVQGQEQDDGS